MEGTIVHLSRHDIGFGCHLHYAEVEFGANDTLEINIEFSQYSDLKIGDRVKMGIKRLDKRLTKKRIDNNMLSLNEDVARQLLVKNKQPRKVKNETPNSIRVTDSLQ
jgi:hypothetical protein